MTNKTDITNEEHLKSLHDGYKARRAAAEAEAAAAAAITFAPRRVVEEPPEQGRSKKERTRKTDLRPGETRFLLEMLIERIGTAVEDGDETLMLLSARDQAVLTRLCELGIEWGVFEVIAAPAWIAGEIGLPDREYSRKAVRKSLERLERLRLIRQWHHKHMQARKSKKWRPNFTLPENTMRTWQRMPGHPSVWRINKPEGFQYELSDRRGGY